MTQEEFEVYARALEQWGAKAQINMLFEEMAELQNAICKFFRNRASCNEVITEIADVQIMAQQMQVLFGNDNVKAERDRKFERLKKRLAKYEAEK